MGLEDILRAMEAESALEREGILAEAQAMVDRILSQAREEAEARRRQRLEAELRTVRAEQARLLNDARLASLKQLSVARDDLIDAAFQQAAKRLERLRGSPLYREVLRRLLEETASQLGPGRVVVKVDPADARLAEELVESLGLDAVVEPTLHCSGGLEASDAEGRIVVRNTFESRLQRAREVLRPELTAAVEAGLEEPVGAKV